jgi:hypothetical protein
MKSGVYFPKITFLAQEEQIARDEEETWNTCFTQPKCERINRLEV